MKNSIVSNSLKEVNDITTSSNNFTLKKVIVNSYGSEKMYMDKELIEDQLYQIIDQSSERKITPKQITSILWWKW